MLSQLQRLFFEELDLATIEAFLSSWDVTKEVENENSDRDMDELADQENAELIKELKNQAIMNVYRYISSMPEYYKDEDIAGMYHEPHSLPMSTPQWQQASSSSQK